MVIDQTKRMNLLQVPNTHSSEARGHQWLKAAFRQPSLSQISDLRADTRCVLSLNWHDHHWLLSL